MDDKRKQDEDNAKRSALESIVYGLEKKRQEFNAGRKESGTGTLAGLEALLKSRR